MNFKNPIKANFEVRRTRKKLSIVQVMLKMKKAKKAASNP